MFRLKDGQSLPIPASLEPPPGAKLMFRPQHVTLRREAGDGLAGEVVHREFLGASVRYGVRVGSQEIGVDAPFQTVGELLEVGDKASLVIARERMRLLGA